MHTCLLLIPVLLQHRMFSFACIYGDISVAVELLGRSLLGLPLGGLIVPCTLLKFTSSV